MDENYFSFSGPDDFQEKYDNATHALQYWLDHVKPNEVSSGLSFWICGTVACLCGHLTRCDYFKAQGLTAVQSQESGDWWIWLETPTESFDGTDISKPLFGVPDLFSPSGSCQLDDDFDVNGSDYDLVTHRLKSLMKLMDEI